MPMPGGFTRWMQRAPATRPAPGPASQRLPRRPATESDDRVRDRTLSSVLRREVRASVASSPAAVRALILSVWSNGPGTVVLSGEAGAGKTALLEQLATSFTAAGQFVQFARRGDEVLLPGGPSILLVDEAGQISDLLLRRLVVHPGLFCVLAARPAAVKRLQAAGITNSHRPARRRPVGATKAVLAPAPPAGHHGCDRIWGFARSRLGGADPLAVGAGFTSAHAGSGRDDAASRQHPSRVRPTRPAICFGAVRTVAGNASSRLRCRLILRRHRLHPRRPSRPPRLHHPLRR